MCYVPIVEPCSVVVCKYGILILGARALASTLCTGACVHGASTQRGWWWNEEKKNMSAVCFPCRRSISIKKIKNIFVWMCECVLCAVHAFAVNRLKFLSFLTPICCLFSPRRCIPILFRRRLLLLLFALGPSSLFSTFENSSTHRPRDFVVCLRLRISCTIIHMPPQACTGVVGNFSMRKTFSFCRLPLAGERRLLRWM